LNAINCQFDAAEEPAISEMKVCIILGNVLENAIHTRAALPQGQTHEITLTADHKKRWGLSAGGQSISGKNPVRRQATPK